MKSGPRRFAETFPEEQRALSDALQELPAPEDRERWAIRLLLRFAVWFFLEKNGLGASETLLRNYRCLRGRVPLTPFDLPGITESCPQATIASATLARTFAFLDSFRWSLAPDPQPDDLTPDILALPVERRRDRRQTGAYYTGKDVTAYVVRSTILPYLLDAVGVDSTDDLITGNCDLLGFTLDKLAHEGAAFQRNFRAKLRCLTILDPTCGCGDFLLAALDLLEPLYIACGESAALSCVLRDNLHGVDLMPEAVEVSRLRLLLRNSRLSRSERAFFRGAKDDDGAFFRGAKDDNLRTGNALSTLDWCGAFPEAMRSGFSVVVGNPPYVEASAESAGPELGAYRTRNCGNLYAYVVERSLSLLADDGRIGMIVPHSAFCTDRMAPLLSLLTERAVTWISTYDIRPGKLFAGVDQRLAIFLSRKADQRRVYSTRYQRWHQADRSTLFHKLRYLDVSELEYENSIPKAGASVEAEIWRKLHRFPPLGDDLAGRGVIYYHNAPRYWVRAMTFAPYFWNEREGAKLSTQMKPLAVPRSGAEAIAALLNSDLFCWWWLLLSDCRHLNRREIEQFPFGLSRLAPASRRQLGKLCRQLMKDYQHHAVRKRCRYQATGRVEYDEYYPGKSKAILDAIDAVLAEHYGLTEDELRFIVTHDAQFRGDE